MMDGMDIPSDSAKEDPVIWNGLHKTRTFMASSHHSDQELGSLNGGIVMTVASTF